MPPELVPISTPDITIVPAEEVPPRMARYALAYPVGVSRLSEHVDEDAAPE